MKEFFGEIFWEDFLGGFFGRIFLRGFVLRGFWRGLFLEEFFGRNSLFHFNVEEIDLVAKILVFVKILGKGRRKEGKLQSLEMRAKAHHT